MSKRPPMSKRPVCCEDCGIKGPYLTFIDWDGGPERWACEHRYACEARQMLIRGESVGEAAAHAQQRRPW